MADGAAAGSPAKRQVYSLAIELTASCNQKCAYCYNAWRDDGGRSVETGATDVLLERVGKVLAAWTLDHVTLTGGEPFSHAGLFPLLELLGRHGVRAQIISNGGIVTSELARKLAPHRVRFVQVTLNGPTRELHEEHVGPNHFDKTLRGIEALRDAGVPVVGCIVVTRKNARHVGETLELWKRLGAREIALSRFSPAGYAAENAADLLPSLEDVSAAFEQALPHAREGMAISSTMPIPPCVLELERFAPIRFGFCAVGSQHQEFALGPDGKLRHCTLHRGTLDQLDATTSTEQLLALLDAPAVREYRRQVPDFCRGCLHETTCAGGCGAASEWVLGSRRRVDPFVAQHVDDEFAAELAARRSTRIHLAVVS